MPAPIMTNRRDLPTEFRRRLAAAIGIVLVVFGLTTIRLWRLQISEGERYRSLSENNRIRLRRVRATRGVILDRHGLVVVDNRPSFDLPLRMVWYWSGRPIRALRAWEVMASATLTIAWHRLAQYRSAAA